jgi:hypothetical protein
MPDDEDQFEPQDYTRVGSQLIQYSYLHSRRAIWPKL